MSSNTLGFIRFNTGEISALMSGRIDTEEYSGACQVLQNFIPSVQGPVSRRGGTRFVSAVKDSNKKVRLYAFQFSVTQAYLLEFGDKYIRFFNHGQAVLKDGVSYEIASPYGESDLDGLYFSQSGDVVFIAHKDFPLKTLTRYAEIDWRLADFTMIDGPYLPVNADNVSITPSAVSGAMTLTASAALFKPTDIGRQVRLMHANKPNVQWGCATITEYVNATSVKAVGTDGYPFMATTATKFWRLGVFSKTTGYANAVTFFEQRLVLGKGNGVYGSKVGQYELFSPTAADASVTAEYGYGCELSSDQINDICWLSSGRALAIGTVGADFTLTATSGDTSLPLNVKVQRHSTFGSEAVQPVKVSHATLFVQHYGRKVRAFQYDSNSDDYVARDVTTLAPHMTFGGIKEMALQQEPVPVVWCLLKNGKLAGLTYEAEESVSAWHTFQTENGVVESIASLPTANGEKDELYLLVRRVVNGKSVRYIEVMETGLPEDAQDSKEAFFVDCGASYHGEKASVISGLEYLEGQTVAVLADGAVQNEKTVKDGKIVLDTAASVVHAGLPFTSVLQTMPLSNGAAEETAKKRIVAVLVRLYKSIGFKIGLEKTGEHQSFRQISDVMGIAPALFTGDKKVAYSGGWENGVSVRIEQNQPLPLTILSVFPVVAANKI